MNIKLSLNSFLIILLFISTTLQTSSLENTLNRTPFSQEIAKSKKSIDDYLELKKAKIPTEIIEESIKPPIEEIQKIKNLKNELNNETQNELNNIDNQIKEIKFYETILNFFGLDPEIKKLYNKRAELKEQQKRTR